MKIENFEKVIEPYGEDLFLEKGHVLFQQGSLDSSFYYIKEGIVELQFDGKTRRRLQAGEFFGEIRALGQLPRTASAACMSSCQLIELSHEKLFELLSTNQDFKEHLFSKYGSRLLHARTRSDKYMLRLQSTAYDEILAAFKQVTLPENTFLFSKGDPSDSIYFILRGTVLILDEDKPHLKRRPGDFIGEIGVLNNRLRSASAFATGPVELLECSATELKKLFKRFRPLESFLQSLAIDRLVNNNSK